MSSASTRRHARSGSRAGGIDPKQDPYFEHYARVKFDGSSLVTLTEGDGTHQVNYSPDRQWLVDTWSRVDLPL